MNHFGFGSGAQSARAGTGSVQTDDRGRYRISGLSPGKYIVRAAAEVPVPVRGDERSTRTFSLFTYAPDKVRRADAAVVTMAGAEEHGDLAIVVGLAGLRSVSGTVSATGATVRSGNVNLTDQADSALNRSATIGADGSFVLIDVPPGNYSLTVNASAQAPGTGVRGGQSMATGSMVSFQPLQATVAVANDDVTGLSFAVTVATASQ